MPGSFDPTLKDLLESGARDWLAWMGLPVDPCEWIDADTSAIQSEADKVLRVDSAPEPWILHLEVQADHDLTLPLRMQKYFGILRDRHQLQVHSMAVLLRRAANASNLTGELRSAAPGARPSSFCYSVIRLWEQPVQPLLSGGIGILPLAPLADVKTAELPRVISTMERRLDQEATPAQRVKLWAATYILMGLSWENALIEQVLQGVRAMKSSVTYQAILAEGREEGREVGREEGSIIEARTILMRQGRKKFGRPPTKRLQAMLDAIADVEQLETLAERLLEVNSWSELLDR